MKKLFLILAVLFHFCALGRSVEKPVIAVFTPECSGLYLDEGTKLAVREIISSTIVNIGDYNIVESSQLEKTIREYRNVSGGVDDVQAVEVGKAVGADKIVLSLITLTGSRNMVSIKIIDVNSANVEYQKTRVVPSDTMIDVIEPLTYELLGKEPPVPVEVAAEQNSSGASYGSDWTYRANVPSGEVNVYGVDFSAVRIYGANETDEKFAVAFSGINDLLISQSEKYNFARMLNKHVVVYTAPVCKQNDNMSWWGVRSVGPSLQKRSLEQMVAAYDLPHQSGTGLVIIAWLLNKSAGIGVYEVVLFDIETRKIIFNQDISTKAGGAGLRNYWANSVYEVINNKRLQKTIRWTLEK